MTHTHTCVHVCPHCRKAVDEEGKKLVEEKEKAEEEARQKALFKYQQQQNAFARFTGTFTAFCLVFLILLIFLLGVVFSRKAMSEDPTFAVGLGVLISYVLSHLILGPIEWNRRRKFRKQYPEEAKILWG